MDEISNSIAWMPWLPWDGMGATSPPLLCQGLVAGLGGSAILP